MDSAVAKAMGEVEARQAVKTKELVAEIDHARRGLLVAAQELEYAHPELCDELRLINLELRAGKARAEALHNLAERTGVDDVASLSAMLVQTDKFGTSVAQSLRVHSETLRTKRRQRAEEQAAKTTIKMVVPMVLFILPSIIIVMLVPALIMMYRTATSR